MASITITIDDETKKVLTTRAKKNFFTLKEQIEDIVRKSAIRTKNCKTIQSINVDDRLISIFARDRKRKTK